MFNNPLKGPGLISPADPRWRIAALIGVLIMLIAMFVGLRSFATSPGANRGPQVPDAQIGITGEDLRFTGIPSLDNTLAERIRDIGPDARRDWEPEAMRSLLLQARHTPAVHAYNLNLLPITPESAAEIAKDSRPWRFKFVRFRGELEYIGEENYEARYGGNDELGLVHRGRIRIAGSDTVRVAFVAPTGPRTIDPNSNDPIERYEEIQDGWVRGRGILVKNFLDVGPEGGEVPAILVVATQIERDYETRPVERLEDIPFQMIEDDLSLVADGERHRLLFKSYPLCMFRLIRYAEARAGEAGRALRQQEKLEPRPLETLAQYEEVRSQPARFRAQYFGGLGVLADHPVSHDPESTEANDAGVEEYLHGFIANDRLLLLQFVAPASLAGKCKKGDRIRYEGFFYKTRAYNARNGSEQLRPMLVLTVLEKVVSPKPSYVGPLVIASLFVAGIVAFVFIVVREDRTKDDYRRSRRKRVVAGQG
jgi:hypothetical protein